MSDESALCRCSVPKARAHDAAHFPIALSPFFVWGTPPLLLVAFSFGVAPHSRTGGVTGEPSTWTWRYWRLAYDVAQMLPCRFLPPDGVGYTCGDA